MGYKHIVLQPRTPSKFSAAGEKTKLCRRAVRRRNFGPIRGGPVTARANQRAGESLDKFGALEREERWKRHDINLYQTVCDNWYRQMTNNDRNMIDNKCEKLLVYVVIMTTYCKLKRQKNSAAGVKRFRQIMSSSLII